MTNDDTKVLIGPVSSTVRTRLGDVVVRQLTIDDISLISQELFELFSSLPKEMLESRSEKAVILHMIAHGGLTTALKHLLAAMSGRPSTDFDSLSLVDFGKLMLAFLKLNPLSELRQLFFDLKGAVTPPPETKK